ncbi:Glycoside hydrolase, family 42, N-terminal [Kalmanozyma brasiliensis GHG001]|uniref:beta-galactosidase n=1 Tax=Kalmanozyma brasiliensis (strain GHG001) TaxID=1365824 RepID=V5EPE2_KALBG|nr:Glycoside hydrolase, family 42, N-terminal [Kalmanozyma brasiliensis GHG001]EST04808.1 Glycoside hydrolase, family 42, N-terminal [Kalmanozyma brasiliensis GHG001]
MLAGKWTKLASLVALLPTVSFAFPSSRDFDLESSSLFTRDYIPPDVDRSSPYPFSPTRKPDSSRWPKGLHFAVDYYPAQWPEFLWADDAARMANATLSYARISEFDWAILEPTDGTYDWSTLDQSIDALYKQGVKVILGTPTATPPIWAVKNYDILGADAQGRQRKFGSRRHYSTSSPDYRMLSKRFVTAMAQRYGRHEAVAAWQIDNELGCHSTVRTYDNNARTRYQQWLADKYNNNITQYNQAEGRVFWSSTYQSFDQIDVPMLEVTESSPAGRLDFYHFSSDMTIEYAKDQVDIIRSHSDKAITTNFMGAFLDFDHFKLARETGLDLATWDSYPLGNTEQFAWISDSDKIKYGRTGTPDFQALHHDLYRGVAGAAYNKTAGPFGIMEQQPGPVNWAPYNPSPKLGMVRLWQHETFAHGGSMNNIFRWREVPYAQEQMHAAMLRRDNVPDHAYIEQQQVVKEDLPKMASLFGGNTTKRCVADNAPVQTQTEGQAQVALVFDYAVQWLMEAEPQSGTWTTDMEGFEDPSMQYFPLVFNWYSALRRLGLNIDVVGPSTSLEGYKMVVVPSMPILSDEFVHTWSNFKGLTVFGPRSASKVAALAIPDGLPPSNGPVRDVLPMKVTRVETIKDGFGDQISYAGQQYNVSGWVEWIECSRDNKTSSISLDDSATYYGYRNGTAATCGNVDGDKQTHYVSAYTPVEFLVSYLGDLAGKANVTNVLGQTPSGSKTDLGTDLRFRRNGNALWAFNYGPDEIELPAAPQGATLLVGGEDGKIGATGVAVWSLA